MIETNAENIVHAIEYLEQTIDARLELHFCTNESEPDVKISSLAYYEDGSVFSCFIKEHQPSFDEYIVLLLALVPHIKPGFLDAIIKRALQESGNFPEIGGTRDNKSRVFLPTGETALFVLAGDDLDKRFEVQQIFSGDHWFAQQKILKLEPSREGNPIMGGRLLMSPDYVELFTIGRISSPNFSAAFPALEIKTELEWDDLVLNQGVLEQIGEIKNWVQHNKTLLKDWGMARKIKPGFRALFYGPPGTGKTLTATLLGKYTGRKVFRIDLSTVVSKYIGETEKNLSALFNKARHREWILFFDEADALFGKRTTVKDSHDRFANQEISYLLQRVEEFDGLIILASNFKANMDEAFLRRFNSIIQFPFPEETERTLIWRKSFPGIAQFEKKADLPLLLGRFELAGGSIINVVHYACLKSIARSSNKEILLEDVLSGIRKEVEKEGKVFKNIIREAWETGGEARQGGFVKNDNGGELP